MPPSTTHTILDELEAREAQVERARELERTREHELRERTRSLTELRMRRDEYERRVGAGSERDSAFERETAEELAGAVEYRAVSRYGADPEFTLVDPRAESRLEGAKGARLEREEELRAFVAEHLLDLHVAVFANEDKHRKRVLKLVAELREAIEPLTAAWRRTSQLYSLGGAPGQGPAEPYGDLRRAVARAQREEDQ